MPPLLPSTPSTPSSPIGITIQTPTPTRSVHIAIRPEDEADEESFTLPYLTHGHAAPPNSPDLGFIKRGGSREDLPAMSLAHLSLFKEAEKERGLTDALSLEELSLRERMMEEEGGKREEIFVIGISGVSSSGKSVLAELLKEAFEGVDDAIEITIITQDDFFIPKHLCPEVTFKSTPKDANFMAKTLSAGIFDCIITSLSRSSGSCSAEVNYDASRPNITRNNTSSYMNSVASRIYEGGHKPIYEITGTNRDCDEAIDWYALYHKIQAAITGEEHNENGLSENPHTTPDVSVHASAIESMKKYVSDFGGLLSSKRGKNIKKIVIVEGFLLFEDPVITKKNLATAEPVMTAEEIYAIAKTFKSEDSPDWATMSDDEVQIEIDKREALMKSKQDGMKSYLQSLFDVKLFLPIFKDTARRRRFQRPLYIDEELGGGRKLDQVIRTEGYWEDVVWGGFEKSYGWLIEGGKWDEGQKSGVEMCPIWDAEVEVGLKWAIECVLRGLGFEWIVVEGEREGITERSALRG